jgi:FlaA1/EpsC-like NDP-sugar epimerase
MMVFDAALVNIAVYLALYLRFDTPHVPRAYLDPYLHVMPLFSGGAVAIFLAMRVYHRLWQYASARDGLLLAVAISVSALWFTVLIYMAGGAHYPRAVFALYWLLTLLLVGGTRAVRRSMTDLVWRRPLSRSQALILGAGKAGQLVVAEMARHPEVGQAVGFLDDDPAKQGMQMGSLRVLGRLHDLERVVQSGVPGPIDQIIVAMPSVEGRVLRGVVDEARRLQLRVRILPGVNQMIDGKVRVSQIRDVEIEDLLQREPAHIDLAEIAGYLTGRTVMVTGAGGSIGGELARQVARFDPQRLLLVGIDETSVFDIHQDILRLYPTVAAVPVVADLRDKVHLGRLFEAERPQVIFHAAAHKHVPLMEAQPDEAIRNNVGGLWNVAELADRYRVDSLVFISTDKAVNPASVYGATKRAGELLMSVMAERSRHTRFVSVRFGNVLGTRGSVVPIFQQQIRAGGPVTVTHPEMVRYFMTATEAAQLVIQAGAMGQGGEIFVLDMGEPVRILDLAMNLIRLSGLRPGEDIEIQIVGMRPGEKLYEELLTGADRARVSRHQRIFIAQQDGGHADAVLARLDEVLGLAEAGQAEAAVAALGRLVPEYRPNRPSEVHRLAAGLHARGDEAHAVEP